MKLNLKNTLKAISKSLTVCFSALFAVFSMKIDSPNYQKSFSVEKIESKSDNSYGSNLILQTPPPEENKWSDKLKKDLNQLNYDHYNQYSFTQHNLNQNSNYLDLSHSYQAIVYVKTYFRASWGALGGDWGGLKLDGASFSLKNSYGTLQGEKVIGGWYERGGKTSWGKSDTYTGSTSFTIPLSFTGDISKTSTASSIFLDLHSPHYNDVEDQGYFQISHIKLYDRTLRRYILDQSADLKWSTPTGGTGNDWRRLTTSPKTLSSDKTFYTQKYSDRAEQKNLNINKVFISKKDLNNKSWTEDELKNLINITENGNSINHVANISNISLDKENKLITFDTNIRKSLTNYYDPKKITIPIVVTDFNYLITGSSLSDSYWEHLPNGETRYHTTKPRTKLKISEDFIKALYIIKNKQNIINKLNNDIWGFVNNDKQIAINLANSYILNYDNYSKIKNLYLNSRDKNVFQSLAIDSSLSKYIDQFTLDNATIEDYLYLIVNSNITFDYGITTFTNKSISLKDLINKKGINISISDAETRNLGENRTNWKMNIKNLKINPISSSQIKSSLNSNFKFDLLNTHLFPNYDLRLGYYQSSEYWLEHEYLYQAKGIDISEKISFITEDGSYIDQNFKVIKPSSESHLNINDYAYIAIRYWATFKSKQKEYVTLERKNNDWFSPKYNDFIKNLDSNFSENKIEYLFNQDLQMIINPYENNGTKIDSNTPQTFGIKRVIDEVDGNEKILEDWTDGYWSHTHSNQGIAIFDGIFGSDPNGIFDSKGRLSEGKHHIKIELQNLSFTGLKNDFIITIDKNIVDAKVSGTTRNIEKEIIIDTNSNNEELYFSNGPIHFEVKDIDLKNVKATFIDYQGNWYELPINIFSKKIDGKWKTIVNSTIDYAGFVRVEILDQAGNKKIIYFWLKQNENRYPKLEFDTSLLFDSKSRKISGDDLKIFNSEPSFKITSPLVSSIEVDKREYQNGSWKPVVDFDSFTISDYDPTLVDSDAYNFGKTISSSQSVLKYSGDELSPYTIKSNFQSWPVTNKLIDINKPGMYRITLNTRYLENPTITKYIYVTGEHLNPFNIDKSVIDKTNFLDLPKSDEGPISLAPGTQDPIDSDYPFTKKLIINMPDFLIERYLIEYSLLWYSDFQKSNLNLSNISQEGKYKFKIIDIFGNEYEENILIINKDLSLDDRKKLMLSPIYLDPQKKDETSFYKGTVVWNYWRYEDEDHAKWEHDAFIANAIKNGLTPEQAEALYKKWKKDPNNGKTPDWKGWDAKDWKNKFSEFENKWKNASNKNSKWEHDAFIANAIKNGLPPKQAEALYKKWKKDPNNGKTPDWKGWDAKDWKNKFSEFENKWKNASNKNSKWEHDAFIANAIKNGLPPKQAEALYKKWKKVPNNGQTPDWKGWDAKDWKNKFSEFENKWKNASNKNPWNDPKKKKTLIGIIVGSSSGGTLLISALSYLLIRRHKNRKIS